MKAKVSKRGQVTIPKSIRMNLGLVPGTVLQFEADEGKLITVKVQLYDPVDAVYGTLGLGRSSDELAGELRDRS